MAEQMLVFEVGEKFATMGSDGLVRVWLVTLSGDLAEVTYG